MVIKLAGTIEVRVSPIYDPSDNAVAERFATLLGNRYHEEVTPTVDDSLSSKIDVRRCVPLPNDQAFRMVVMEIASQAGIDLEDVAATEGYSSDELEE